MRILLIEDNEDFCETLTYQLETEGYTTDVCGDGADAFYYLKTTAYDLILLDVMLPHIDGLTLLRTLRREGNHTPVILLTALGELGDKITGLDAGADDYLVKPFAFEELLARIRCICRRPRQWEQNDTLSFRDVTYVPSENKLSGTLGSCTLSRKEGMLVEFFLRNPGQTLPRAVILSRVWGPEGTVEDGNLDNYIHFIRRRLRHVTNLVSIKTIRGVGYGIKESDQ